MHQSVVIRCKHAHLSSVDPAIDDIPFPSIIKNIEHQNECYLCDEKHCDLNECKPEPVELKN